MNYNQFGLISFGQNQFKIVDKICQKQAGLSAEKLSPRFNLALFRLRIIASNWYQNMILTSLTATADIAKITECAIMLKVSHMIVGKVDRVEKISIFSKYPGSDLL